MMNRNLTEVEANPYQEIINDINDVEVRKLLANRRDGFTEGFNAHQKLVEDKLFTVGDMIKAIHSWDNHINMVEEDKGSIKQIETFVQSIVSKSVDIEFGEKVG